MPETRRPLHVLRHRDFRRLWISQFVSLTGSQIQLVAINWHVYLLTHSPLALGFVGLTRVVPIIAFSLLGGIVADRRDRRWVMFASQAAMTVVAGGLGAATLFRLDSIWLIYALNALSAAAVAFDNPTRQALVPRLVPRKELPGALSLNLTIFHVSMFCGPALAGLLIAGAGAHDAASSTISVSPSPTHTGAGAALADSSGLGWLYLLNAVSFVGVLATLFTMDPSVGRADPGTRAADHPIEALREGLRFVFRTPLMVWTMALDFFATFFSGAVSLLPIFADQILRTGPVGYGMLVAAPGIGALVGSIYASVWPLPRRQGRVFLWSVGVYGLATVVFGLSRSYMLTFLALAVAGLADLVSTVIRQTLRQLITPDRLRGRMTSINMIFFMGGPQLGELEAGLVASLFATAALGASISVVSGGLATLITVLVVTMATPALRNYEFSAWSSEEDTGVAGAGS